MKFYNNVNPRLRQFVNHYWQMSGDLDSEKIYEILPMDHSDILIKIKGDFYFVVKGNKITPSEIFFQGIKSTPMFLKQTEFSETIGISFKPWGLFSVIPQEMNKFQDEIVDVEEWNNSLAQGLYEFRNRVLSEKELDIKKLEDILLESLMLSEKDMFSIENIQRYIDSGESIDEFSNNNGISRRKIERDFNKYIGISPSKFNQIQKFEFVSRELLYSQGVDLSDLTNEGDYYDQPHFNRQFKRYSEKTPNVFLKDNTALKSIIDFK